jgi:hypothetical protein
MTFDNDGTIEQIPDTNYNKDDHNAKGTTSQILALKNKISSLLTAVKTIDQLFSKEVIENTIIKEAHYQNPQ